MRYKSIIGLMCVNVFLVMSCNNPADEVKREIDQTNKMILENSRRIDRAQKLLDGLKDSTRSYKYVEKDSLGDEIDSSSKELLDAF